MIIKYHFQRLEKSRKINDEVGIFLLGVSSDENEVYVDAAPHVH